MIIICYDLKRGVDMEVRFIKVGNEYVNATKLERAIVIDEDDFYLTTLSGREFMLSHKHDPNAPDYASSVMNTVARKVNEKAHDIIYIEAFTMKDESLLADDQSSNLMYRKWLETQDHKPLPASDTHVDQPGELLKDGVLKLLKKK